MTCVLKCGDCGSDDIFPNSMDDNYIICNACNTEQHIEHARIEGGDKMISIEQAKILADPLSRRILAYLASKTEASK